VVQWVVAMFGKWRNLTRGLVWLSVVLCLTGTGLSSSACCCTFNDHGQKIDTQDSNCCCEGNQSKVRSNELGGCKCMPWCCCKQGPRAVESALFLGGKANSISPMLVMVSSDRISPMITVSSLQTVAMRNESSVTTTALECCILLSRLTL